jgi:hypothetical protein
MSSEVTNFSMPEIQSEARAHPSLRGALGFWWKLGWISFGGTAAHLAIMHSELVEKRRWIDSDQFFHALSHRMLLPGPEAQQLSISTAPNENKQKTRQESVEDRDQQGDSVLKLITAAVVAAILQVTVFLVRGVLFSPGSSSPNLWAAVWIFSAFLLTHLTTQRVSHKPDRLSRFKRNCAQKTECTSSSSLENGRKFLIPRRPIFMIRL